MKVIKENIVKVPIFQELPDEALIPLIKAGSIIKYFKDQIILEEKEEGSSLFFLLSGKVKIIRKSEDDKEVILNILREHDFFGEMSILDGYTRSATVIAMEDSELFVLRRKEFISLIEHFPDVSIKLIQIISKRLRLANLKIKALSIGDSEKKVGSVLLHLAIDCGKYANNCVEISDLPIQKEIANMAGTSRETVSRVFHILMKKGLINYDEEKITILDFEKFQEAYK
ncbi:MAG: Crp/Fnr family transcriptional regulator [Ignavibacteria bacterium]|nr:MAG: Crp/Fnr family transcriptional regulator [Ignavibacteria bacterium]